MVDKIKGLCGDEAAQQARVPEKGVEGYSWPVWLRDSSGVENAHDSTVTVEQSGTAGYTADSIDVVETSVGSGVKKLLERLVNGVSKFFVDNAGVVRPTGLSFDGVNILSAYKEQTPFTPTVNVGGGAGVTYDRQDGYYHRIGNMVFFNAHVVLTSKGGGSGTVAIEGLPVPSNTAVNNINSLSVGDAHGLAITAGQNIAARIDNNSSTISLSLWDGVTGAGSLQDGDITNTFWIDVSGHYFV